MDVNHYHHNHNGNDFTFRDVVKETWTRVTNSFLYKAVQKNVSQRLQPGFCCHVGVKIGALAVSVGR